MTGVIELRDVSKRFVIRHNRAQSLQGKLLGLFHREHRERREEFWALRDISFDVDQGEALALIGANGSGKSTLLKLIAGTMPPTMGRIRVQGRMAPMIELGLGFNPDLTGQENVYLNASLYGFTRREIDQVSQAIVQFAEMERFIDVPMKNYSSGMYVRLAFAIAIHLHPEILLVDEVLAVGDEHFQRKCIRRIRELQNEGKTIVFVSHNAEQVEMVCNRACLLRQGRIAAIGDPREVLSIYRSEE